MTTTQGSAAQGPSGALQAASSLMERLRYTTSGFSEVTCSRCLGTVSVRKSTPIQTSIQWQAEARARCTELSEDREVAQRQVCESLHRSIAEAVERGTLEVQRPEAGLPEIDRSDGDGRHH